jgi:hypothetical protein
MKKLFKNLTVDEKFHDGKTFGMGFNSKKERWVEFRKINKSEAKVEKLVGWDNNRGLGNLKKFYPYTSVFTLE